MAPKENKKQWENKKLGFIPNPQSERGRFLNEKVLPAFYKSQYRCSMNAREFSKLFHSEGRREYDLHKAISSLEEKIAVQEKPMNMPLSPSDNAQLNYKSTQLENLKMKAEQISKELKNDDDSCFTNLGKVKSTHVCAHHFNESCTGRLNNILQRIKSTICETSSLQDKHKRMFPGKKNQATSLKRRQKENKAKSKKRKQERHENQMKRVYNLIAHCTQEGQFSTLNYTGISEIKKSDFKWLKMLMERKMLPDNACLEIKSLIDLSFSDTSSDDSEDFVYELDV